MPALSHRLLSGLLLTTALVVPAFAQIETVVVTAEKRAEDNQIVPIAVTAFTAADLSAHQITSFRDLNFSTPNVSYTNTNYGGANFQIRGLGNAAVGTDAESGVAVHVDDVFLANPPMAAGTFYDLDQIAILRGPQSTLYGRGATGGSVNIITAKPDLERFGANGEFTYGNYNQTELKGMVNVPLDDTLAVRIAGDWQRHDGFVENIGDHTHADGQDIYSIRGSIRWQPTDEMTINLIGSYSSENDSKMRAQKQLCERDPAGVLGCLPNAAKPGALNVNALFTNDIASEQALGGLGASLAPPGAQAQYQALFSQLGLFDLTKPAALSPVNAAPANLRQINTDVDPTYKGSTHFATINIRQRLTPWLDATLVGGYDDENLVSRESYVNIATPALDPARLGTYDASTFNFFAPSNGALNTLDFLLSGGAPGTSPPLSPAYAKFYAPFFSHPGTLATSQVLPNRIGLTSGDVLNYSPNLTAYDIADNASTQYSGELRFASNLTGPFNFLIAGYYLRTMSKSDYYVAGNVIDYPSIVLGSLGALRAPDLCLQTGCTRAPGFYHNFGRDELLESKSIFGEVYYDILPEELKFTLGARFTDDHKSASGRIAFTSGFIPIGSQNENEALAALVSQHQIDFDPTNGTPPYDLYENQSKSFDKWTGRAVLNWTPKTEFSDQTSVYASYARGYKAGGFNAGVQSDISAGLFGSYEPEGIDALELGTKNTFLDGTLQANLSVWYYNYENLQVSSVVSNTTVNANIGARLWGFEGEFLYAPDDNWAFNMSFGHTDSAVGDTLQVDTRNPSAGRSDVVLVKDATATGGAGQNCVLYRVGGAGFATPADAHVLGFFAPPGGSAALAGDGVPYANFGQCGNFTAAQVGALNAAGFSTHDPRLTGTKDNSGGAPVQLHGNELPNTPPWTLSMGAQYTWTMASGYSVVPRADFYWQDSSWGRIFEDGADRLDSWVQLNAQLTLNAPDGRWYAQVFGKNLTGSDAITGKYLQSATSALYTNAFLTDPTTYGIRLGARF